MLAYDLYAQNLSGGSTANVKRVKPLKKVFFKKGKVRLDKKTREEYASEAIYKTQELLSMPLNISPNLALPNKVTGAAQPRPYVELFGKMESKTSGTVISFSRGGRNKAGKKISFEASMDLGSRKRNKSATGSIHLNIDTKNYFINNKSLFRAYVDSGLLINDGNLPADNFTAVCDAFFDEIEKRWNDDINERRMDFSLIVLPEDDPVIYRESKQTQDTSTPETTVTTSKNTDAFGRGFTRYASRPTQTAKFVSYDDPAFTVNFAEKEKFYRGIFIGDSSHEMVNIPADKVMQISGLSWLFASVENPHFKFEKTGQGILHQLWTNYSRLKESAGDQHAAKSSMKIVCFKTSQAKVEILIDENLTMKEMEKIFSGIKIEKIAPLALEILIQENGRSVLWSDYVNAVRAFIGRKKIDRTWMISTFARMLRAKLFEYLTTPAESKKFFYRTASCITALSVIDMQQQQSITGAEDFAYRAGKIVGRYIKFKESVDESSNSLRDILAYSKYDREKLRFAIQRVGLGVALSKADPKKLDEISAYIKKEIASAAEISDDKAHNDYSYFFYKGAFEELG